VCVCVCDICGVVKKFESLGFLTFLSFAGILYYFVKMFWESNVARWPIKTRT